MRVHIGSMKNSELRRSFALFPFLNQSEACSPHDFRPDGGSAEYMISCCAQARCDYSLETAIKGRLCSCGKKKTFQASYRRPILLPPSGRRPLFLNPEADHLLQDLRPLWAAAGGRARAPKHQRRGREPGQPHRRTGARGGAQGQRARVRAAQGEGTHVSSFHAVKGCDAPPDATGL